jgi:hypothetical protein
MLRLDIMPYEARMREADFQEDRLGAGDWGTPQPERLKWLFWHGSVSVPFSGSARWSSMMTSP